MRQSVSRTPLVARRTSLWKHTLFIQNASLIANVHPSAVQSNRCPGQLSGLHALAPPQRRVQPRLLLHVLPPSPATCAKGCCGLVRSRRPRCRARHQLVVGPRRPSRMPTAVSLLTRVLGPPSTLAQWLADSSTESLEAAQGAQVARSAAAAPPAQLNTQPPVTLGVPAAAAPRVVASGAQPRRVGVVLDAQGKAAPVNIVTTCVVTRADPVAADGVHVGAVLATRCVLTSWPRRTSGTLFMDRTRTGLDLSRSVPPPTQRTRLLAAAPVAVSVYCGSSRASEPSQAQQRQRRRPQSEHVSQQPGAGGTRAGEHAAAGPVHGNRSSGGGA